MNFFWTTPAGFYDFAGFSLLALIAYMVSRLDGRAAVYALLAIQLCDRLTVAFNLELVALGLANALVASVLLYTVSTSITRVVAAIFLLKLLGYVLFTGRLVSLETTIAIDLAAVLMQFLVILSGAARNGIRNRFGGLPRGGRAGFSGLGYQAARVSPQRPSTVQHPKTD